MQLHRREDEGNYLREVVTAYAKPMAVVLRTAVGKPSGESAEGVESDAVLEVKKGKSASIIAGGGVSGQ